MNKKSAAEVLREKYMAQHLKKAAETKAHPDMSEMHGMDYLKNEIASKIAMPLFEPERYRDIGGERPKTLLIHGVPGTGKSFLLNCFCQTHWLPLISGYLETAKDVKDLFGKARSTERSIILIKNIENYSAEARILYELREAIRAMDFNALVVFTASTPVDFVPYDSEIFVRIPTLYARQEIIEGLIKKLRTESIDTLLLARNTPGFVPGQLVRLMSLATTRALERASQPSVQGLSINNSSDININSNPNSNINSSPNSITDDNNSINNNSINNSNNNNINMNKAAVKMEDFIESIREWKNLKIDVTFDDIGALGAVKEELTTSILLPSRYPERFRRFGIAKPGGILLYGPPGCGKTLVARAVSNVAHCNFLSIKGPELITKFVGDSEKKLRDLFQRAKALSPCVLFFDEIDSLCGVRGRNEFSDRIVNQILTLMDGLDDRGEVYLIGATNRIKSIDGALLRPGRFDKVIEVPFPDEKEAREIFEKCASKMPMEPFSLDGFSFENLSGADISGIVNLAAVLCLRDNFDTADLVVSREYFVRAFEKFREMKDKLSEIE
ncbi:ribosome biogenesis ATPase [Enteropsectra breve]|nr:ribosome biogenesis ATPase [Enteropsectra breve]